MITMTCGFCKYTFHVCEGIYGEDEEANEYLIRCPMCESQHTISKDYFKNF